MGYILCHTDIFYLVGSLCTAQAHLQSCEKKKKKKKKNKIEFVVKDFQNGREFRSPIARVWYVADLSGLENLQRRPEGEKATSATSTSHKTDISWAFLNRLLLRLENVT
jgi:hypothetical protein